jgi:hypothetical protein
MWLGAIALFGQPVERAVAGDWPQYGGDAEHSARSTASFNPLDLKKSWLSPDGYADPRIVGQSVIATKYLQSGPDRGFTVTSFRLSDGRVNWTHFLPSLFPASVASADGLVVYTNASPTDPQNGIALYVRDVVTGNLKYTVENIGGRVPTLAHDVDGSLVAYCGTSAVRLGAQSGQVLWSASGLGVGDLAAPTVAGNSIILAGLHGYFAIDRQSGAVNTFSTRPGTSRGETAAYDPQTQRIYGINGNALSAFNYVSQDQLPLVWQKLAYNDSMFPRSPVVGPNGKIYSVGMADGYIGLLSERDPDTGEILRSITGNFDNSFTPMIQDHYLWAETWHGLNIYDLNTFGRIGSMPDAPLDNQSFFPAAFDETHAIMGEYDGPGYVQNFQVFEVPEPSSALLAAGSVLILMRRGRN